MKKLLGFLTGVTFSTLAFAGPGVSYAPLAASFINNGTYVAFSNNAAWTYDTASNIFFMPYGVFTNVYSLTTNGNPQLNTWPPAFNDVTIPSDGNGENNGNLSICCVCNITNGFGPLNTNLSTSVMSPVFQHQIYTNLFAAFGAGTNTLTLTFAPVLDVPGSGISLSESSTTFAFDKTFTFVIACTNTALTVITTNLPSTFTQGATKIRLIKVSSDNQVNSPGTIMDALYLRGWTP